MYSGVFSQLLKFSRNMFHKMINVLHPVASEQNSERCGTTPQLNHSLEGNCSIPANKRKASTESESPRKRLRCASGPAQLAFEAVPTKSGKRKASTERGTPEKKQKCGPSCKDSETLGTTNRERTCESSPAYSSASASTPDSGSASLTFACDRARFEEKYLELDMLGEGGFGSVYAGMRKIDNLPVAIKHMLKEDVDRQPVVLNGKTIMVPLEFLLMKKVGGEPASVGNSAAVSVLDWYDLEEEVLLVMERPVPCVSLLSYMENNGGPLEEDVAKKIMKQLVDAALTMHAKGVFHRDIKAENLLIQTGSSDPRVRVIDFGCGCLVKEEPYSTFSGTSAYAPPEFYTSRSYEAAPTTVWQLGTLLYEMLDEGQLFTIDDFLCENIHFNTDVSQDCQNFLEQCLTFDPKERATLEQIQLHPWLQNQDPVTPQTLDEKSGL